MDSFDVPTKESEVLENSHLVAELEMGARGMDVFPVLFGSHIGDFHEVDGGYHRSEGYHLVNLIHTVQGHGSPFKGDVRQPEIELHLDKYWYLEVDGVTVYDDYPDEDYVVSLQVTGYRGGPYSFSEQLKEPIDGRETEYEYDGQ